MSAVECASFVVLLLILFAVVLADDNAGNVGYGCNVSGALAVELFVVVCY